MTYVHGGDGQRSDSPLVETVVSLSNEVRDLRASARLRAVIEQAKGVLVERHRISLDEAFVRLRAMSQEHNVRLVEVAATVVGVALPEGVGDLLDDAIIEQNLPVSPATSNTWKTLRSQSDVRAGVATAITDSLASSIDHGVAAARLLHDLLQPQGVYAVTMYRTGVDGSLRLVGHEGLPDDVVSPWRSIPPFADIPYVRAAVEDHELFWGDRSQVAAQFPAVESSSSVPGGALAVVPVRQETRVTGVVGLIWRTDEDFDDARRKAICDLVQRVAPVLIENVTAADPELEWLQAVLSLNLDPWLLVEATGPLETPEFVVQGCSPLLVDAGKWLGRRILEIWPRVAHDGTLADLTDLLRTGGSWSSTVTQRSDVPWGTPGTKVRAVRLGRRIAVVWRWPASV